MSYDELIEKLPIEIKEFVSFMICTLNPIEFQDKFDNKIYKIEQMGLDDFSLEVIDGIKKI